MSLLLIIVTASHGAVFAQSRTGDVLISAGVYIDDVSIKAVSDLWENYLHSRPDSLYDNPYWNITEKKKFKYFDLLTQTEIGNIYQYLQSYKPTLLSITPIGDYFRIRNLYSMVTDSGFSDPIAITNVYAKRESSGFALYNSLPIVTRSWQRHTIGSIIFICPSNHLFDPKLAQQLSLFVDSFAKQIGVAPKLCEYYFAPTFGELMQAQGFDYYIGEGNPAAPVGYTDVKNSIIYGGGSNEWYPHEFVHLYAFEKYPKADSYLHEGLATFIGGSHGHSLDWHILHADSILSARKDFNIDSSLTGSFQYANLDYFTGSSYIFGGLIVKMIMEKGGWALTKKAMEYGPTPEEGRFKVLQDVFGVERKNAGRFLRKQISYLAHNIPHTIQ